MRGLSMTYRRRSLGSAEAFFRYGEFEPSASPDSAATTNVTSARVLVSVLVEPRGEGETKGDADEVAAGAATARPRHVSNEKAIPAEELRVVGIRVDLCEWLRPR